MATSDNLLGSAMLAAAAFVFTYYTTWALFLPFLESSNSLHSYFPPREWAVRLPAFLLLSGVGAIGLFFGKVMMNEARKKRGGGKKV